MTRKRFNVQSTVHPDGGLQIDTLPPSHYNPPPMRPLLAAGLLACSACASAPCPDEDQVRERAADPAQVFALFQELVRCRDYGLAHNLLSPEARRDLPYEAFAIAFTTFEASRRMIDGAQVHACDPAAGLVRVCNPEFGMSRDLRLKKRLTIHVLDLTKDDVEHLRGRVLGWFRRQTDRADGWHFAYPPDWDYAPVRRACICGRRA